MQFFLPHLELCVTANITDLVSYCIWFAKMMQMQLLKAEPNYQAPFRENRFTSSNSSKHVSFGLTFSIVSFVFRTYVLNMQNEKSKK